LAEFNADILLNVVTTKVDQAINRLEGSFDRLTQKAQSVGSGVTDTSGFKKARTEVDRLAKSLERFGSIGAAAGVVGIAETVNTFSRELQNAVFHIERFGQSWDVANAPLQAFGDLLRSLTAPVDSLTTAFTQLGATGQATAAGIALATTGLLAFGPQVEQAAKGIFGLGKDARKTFDAVTGLNESFTMTASAVKKLEQSISAAGLRQAISEATKEQQNLVASSDDFRKKTVEVLNLEEQLTAELREQQRVIGQIQNERLGAALQRTGLGDAVSGSGQRLLPAFQERGLQELNTGYAEALRLTQQRTAELTTAANVERALTEETTRGVRFREKSAEAAQRLREYNGNVLESAQGIGRTYQASARVQMSWNVALGQMRDLSNQIQRTKETTLKLDTSSLNTTYAQVKAQERLNGKVKKFNDLQAARAKRTGELNESLALGVGFPLLFGAGPGSIAGSFAGSFAGQGFGGQILGGAIGALFDQLAVKLATLTSSLENITAAAGITGTATERYIETLKQNGQETAAMEVATQALARVVGDDGVRALQDFEKAGTQLANAFTQLGTQLLALVADLAGPTAQGVAGAVENTVLFRQAGVSGDDQQQADLARLRNAYGDEYYEILDRILARQRELNAAVEGQAIAQQAIATAQGQAYQQALAAIDIAELDYKIAALGGDIENEKVAALMRQKIEREFNLQAQQLITELTKQEADFMLVTTKLQALQAQYKAAIAGLELKIKTAQESSAKSAASSAASAAKAAAAEQKRIATLQAQLNTSTALLAIDKQIAAAKVDGDKAKLAELEYTRALEASELKIAEIRARRAGEAETQLQIQLEENRLEKQLLDIDTKRALERKKLQESFQATIDGLTIELGLAQAVTREEENRLKLQQKRLSLQGKGLNENEVNQILELEGRLQAAQAPIQQYMTQLQKSLNDVDAQIVRMAQTIETELGSAMSSAITGVITGTQTVEQAFSQMFANIGKAFIDMATQMLAQQLILSVLKGLTGPSPGGLPGFGMEGTLAGEGVFTGAGPFQFRAEGGPVSAGQPYVVGEQGPELFVPGSGGNVVANDIFDATRQAIASGGGTDQAFSENSEALAVANSYTRERMFERERQTMLTGAGGSTTVQTQVINNVEYATIDQVQEVANLSAKKARAQVFSDMRNRPSTRASLGMG
jgi:hypothetical protein